MSELVTPELNILLLFFTDDNRTKVILRKRNAQKTNLRAVPQSFFGKIISLMCKGNKNLSSTQINLALQRLELLLEPDSQELLASLEREKAAQLPALSQQLKKSPGKLKKQLDKLKATGIVFSSKRFPKGYSLNQLKCLKIRLRVRGLDS
jgi:biotin operon repressor